MAIIISKNSALNDDFWKPTAQVVNAVLEDADSEKTEFDKIVSDIAIEKKSKKYAEKVRCKSRPRSICKSHYSAVYEGFYLIMVMMRNE